MGPFGIAVMWVVAFVALLIINNDRFGKTEKEREEYWRKYRL